MTSPMFRQLRLAEIDDTISLLRRFKPTGDLLEIGAGTGWQSKALSESNYRVEAIDLPESFDASNHARNREWPIRDYDGAHIPFPDRSFDIVYSSNVLEHVVDLDMLSAEMKRVLRPDGIAIHLLPNRNWRLLSLLTYYPGQAVDFGRWLSRKHAENPKQEAAANGGPSRGLLGKAFRRLVPHAHGAEGSALHELIRFSRASWDDFFERTDWEVIEYGHNGLIASGDYVFGSALPIPVRRLIGGLTGGIAHVYVVRPKPVRPKAAP